MSYLVIPKFGLAIDWETSGYSFPNYAARHQGISFGAIMFDMQTLDPVETIYHEIKFDSKKYEWDSGAERVHGMSRDYLEKHGSTQEEAAVSLGNLIVKYIGTEPVVLLGHRVYFDQAFTKQLFDAVGVPIEFHNTSIDTAALGGVLMETWKADTIFETLGMPSRGTHNSLEDIMHTLESAKRMKELFLKGVLSELT